ncbi:phospholipid methyltransferase-domain-containing protein [Blastocladiella britannica]|nr:phospholipid methyltransferase-domain-containing protein [Blastocladiella britannica]
MVMQLVDLAQPSFWAAVASIAFNPTMWNIVARREHRTRFLTRLAGSNHNASYVLAFVIFTLGLLRDYLYAAALEHQPQLDVLSALPVQAAALVLFGLGNVLVLSSMWRLGVTGTYLGDYCGILMEERVTAFPFNTMENPMYTGSIMCFIATALWKQSPAGLVISVWVWIVYQAALAYEGPFTGQIYAERDAKRAKKQ